MKKNFLMMLGLIILICSSCYAQNQQILPGIIIEINNTDPNQMILPNPFMIYVRYGVAVNYPALGFVKSPLPTNNDYFGVPGCYIVCYSSDKQSGVYNVGYNTYVMGQVRVEGMYHHNMCVPMGYDNVDISKVSFFKQLCNDKLRSCIYHDCWAGGNTGAWLGIK